MLGALQVVISRLRAMRVPINPRSTFGDTTYEKQNLVISPFKL